MSEMPVPFGLGENVVSDETGGMRVQPIQFKEVTRGHYVAEYARKATDELVVHFYCGTPQNQMIFPMSFPGKIKAYMSSGFGKLSPDQLTVEWIEEFYSWCVIVKELSSIAPPPSDETIESVLLDVMS